MPTRADRGFERYNPEDNQDVHRRRRRRPRGSGREEQQDDVRATARVCASRDRQDGRARRIRHQLGSVLVGSRVADQSPGLERAGRSGPNSLAPASPLSAGIPPIAAPDLGNGVIPIPGNVSAQTVPFDLQRGYITSWNLTVERELFGGWVAEAGYVATRQTRQLGYRELNWADIGGGKAGRQLVQQFGRTASTREVSPVGGQQLRLAPGQGAAPVLPRGTPSRRPTRSAKRSARPASIEATARCRIMIPEYYHLNRSVTGLDRRHNLQLTNILTVPFGKGQKWLKDGGMLSAIVEQLADQQHHRLMSGRPFSVTRVRQLPECARQYAACRSGQAGRRDSRRCRTRHAVLRHDGVRASDRGSLWHGRVQLVVRPRPVQLGFQPVPKLPADGGVQAGVSRRGIQFHEHAEIRQSGCQRQQHGLR